jgi:D-alanyl-D-alanine carboxypeptidase/D-alanyl-D-alanine-endopeptidase (penicillin-binding protein 4)
MHKIIAVVTSISMSLFIATPATALGVPKSFQDLANSQALAKPGILIIDPISQTEIFESEADIPRAPASILKLISSVTAIKAYGADKVFKTSINSTSDPERFILLGEYDPWLTTSASSAKRFQRALSTKLISAIGQTGVDPEAVTIEFNGLFTKDIENLRAFYGNKVKFKRVTQAEVKTLPGLTPLAEISSPHLSDIVGFTLLWSDNTLADRLARNASDEMGFTRDSNGMNKAFQETLKSLDVNYAGLSVKDGSGLSHDDRVSARTIAELLWKIRIEPEFQSVYDGLPVAGESGTLKDRFKKSAKSAKGLVKAKTGWINTSVTLAGYVEVGNNEYVFAVIANSVKPTETSRDLARKTIDKMLATVAKPADEELVD